MLKRFRTDLFGINRLKSTKKYELQAIRQYTLFGDSQPAVVASLFPLLIAAYSDELDAVIMINLPEEATKAYNLNLGDRLLSINIYENDKSNFNSDLIIGPGYLNNWSGFIPTIVDFVSEDQHSIQARKSEISEKLWERTSSLANEYLIKKPGVFRTGIPAYPVSVIKYVRT